MPLQYIKHPKTKINFTVASFLMVITKDSFFHSPQFFTFISNVMLSKDERNEKWGEENNFKGNKIK